jgi:hypothetical protein
MVVSRNELAPGIGHGDKRPIQVLVIEMHGLEKGSPFIVNVLRYLAAVELTQVEYLIHLRCPSRLLSASS